MAKKHRIGSSNRRYRKSISSFSKNNRISGRLSLAGISTAVRTAFHWIGTLNVIKLLKGVKLVVEIVDKIRSLLFCRQPHLLSIEMG